MTAIRPKWCAPSSSAHAVSSSSSIVTPRSPTVFSSPVLMPDSVLHRVHSSLGPPAHAKLCQHVGHIILHRLLGQIHGFGDLSVGHALGDQIEDPLLLSGQFRADVCGL